MSGARLMVPILLVTRPEGVAEDFESAVRTVTNVPFKTCFSPALEIVPLEVENTRPVEHAIFTSSNGIRRAKELGIDVQNLAWCVGHRSTELAKKLEFPAKFAGETVSELLDSVTREPKTTSFVHVSGKHSRGDLIQKLSEDGFKAERWITYDQKLKTPTFEGLAALMGTLPVVLPLFSPRSARILHDVDVKAPLHIVAMSNAVEAEVPERSVKEMVTSNYPDEASMIEATVQVLHQLTA